MTVVSGSVIAPGTYRLQPDRCTVRFHTAHAFGLGPVHGTMAVREGTLVVGDEPGRSSVTATIDAASFTTDRPERDAKVRSKAFLDVARHPAITWVGEAGDGGRIVTGTLTVRGVAVPVELTLAEARGIPNGLRCRATARVDRYAFGVTAGRGLIRRHLDIELDVVATR
jgi:polyisoprenoid-binding protein YceI